MNNHLPGSELIIRPASFTDIPHIRDIAHRTWPYAYETLLGKKQLEYMLDKFYSLDSLEHQMETGHYFYLALLRFEPAGFASFSLLDKDNYKLQKLYALPELHKKGVGKALLQTVETVSKSMGAKNLWLNVNRYNPAINFYVRKGFSVCKKEDIDIGLGYLMNDYVMHKTL